MMRSQKTRKKSLKKKAKKRKRARNEFQEDVWRILRKIPKGITTYKAIAKALNSKAYRAVGNACSKNPYAPKVPCHRVVKSDGRIGGYAKGVKKKIALLEKEGIVIRNGKVIDFGKKFFPFI